MRESNEINLNVFITEAIKPYIYEQYKNIDGIDSVIEILANHIQKKYFTDIKEMWDARDIARSISPYLSFYSRYYLGIIRPIAMDASDVDTEISTDTVKNLYDTGIRYDTRYQYDDFYESQPFISAGQFITFLRFCYDYAQITWTHDFMIRYAAAMTDTDPIDVKMKFFPNKVVYYTIGITKARDFVTAHKNDAYQMNMPACNCYEFQLGDHIRHSEDRNVQMLGYLRPDTWTKA